MLNQLFAVVFFVMYLCIACVKSGVITSSSCDETGKITATIEDGWTVPNTTECVKQTTGSTKDKVNINQTNQHIAIAGCSMNKAVSFVVTKNNDGNVERNGVSKTNAQLKTSITLTCSKIKTDLTQTAALAILRYSEKVESEQNEATETIQMVMDLRNGNTSMRTVTLGATYTLLVAGAGSHDIVVKSCTAAATSDLTSKETDILSSSPSVLSTFQDPGNAVQPVQGKTVDKVATLTGFRLVGSDTVYIKCGITVCANACTTPSPVKRKRKGGRHNGNMHYATLKFNVRDNSVKRVANAASAGNPIPGGHTLKIVILVTIMKTLF